MDKPKHLTFEQLLEGGGAVSLINESVEEPPRESATARALRRWFGRDIERDNCSPA
jgi:hypothetical protein